LGAHSVYAGIGDLHDSGLPVSSLSSPRPRRRRGLQDVTSALPVRQRRRLSLTAPSGSALSDSHHVVAPHLLPTMGTSADSIAGSSIFAHTYIDTYIKFARFSNLRTLPRQPAIL
jgi:hypothetical protein